MIETGQPIQTSGNNLVGLWRPSFVKVDHRLYVYGGGGNVTNDLHVLNLCDMHWETIHTIKGYAPCKRYGHTATLWKHYIIIFGGCNEHQLFCNDVHIFDLEKLCWFRPEVNGAVLARYLHSAAVYQDKLFVYGGFARSPDCTYVLNEISVLDLNTFTWSVYERAPPRYNHSATLVGHKMYIYGGKDEHGNTVSDLFVVNLNAPPYIPHSVLSGSQSSNGMVLLKSQHFCEAVCGKLLVFGKYLLPSSPSQANALTNQAQQQQGQAQQSQSQRNGSTGSNGTSVAANAASTADSAYGLWMLDLDTLEWERQECDDHFLAGGWNFFTVIEEHVRMNDEDPPQVTVNNLFFLGNTDPMRPQGYDHFRDALIINGESLGLYDIPPPRQTGYEFRQLLNNPELSDFVIVAADGQELHVHQVILITRWPHFNNLYRSGMMEAQERRMEIAEPYPVVLAFLKYLYSDELDEMESWQVVCDVLVLSNMYLLHRLKKICCQRLYERHFHVETCTTIFEKAILADEGGLKLLALDFMFKHYGAILKADLLHQLSPFARHEFLSYVPDEAVLQVSRVHGQLRAPTANAHQPYLKHHAYPPMAASTTPPLVSSSSTSTTTSAASNASTTSLVSTQSASSSTSSVSTLSSSMVGLQHPSTASQFYSSASGLTSSANATGPHTHNVMRPVLTTSAGVQTSDLISI
ncbi:hypothetical protein BC940DRAFT_329905 [Gongronella butleri]|nr:hypothetical protein BC940DRAFT_329905 [Gongronella butleri]